MNGGPNMLYNDYTAKLLGLQGVIVTNVEESIENLTIYAEMERKPHNCPCCGTATRTIHDYRKQRVKDAPSRGKNVEIILRKRRYCCPHCGKKFYEEIPFLPKFHRMTARLVEYIIDKLRNERSFTSVAKETKLSVTTVIRVFDVISYPKMLHLPEALSIDEFKGNTWGEKYQCIITDPVQKTVLDILPERYSYYLSQYFNRYPKGESHGNVNRPVINMIIGGILKLIVVYYLTGNPAVGIVGTPIGTLVSYVVICVLNVLTIRSMVEDSPRIVKNLLRPLLAACVMGIVVWLSWKGMGRLPLPQGRLGYALEALVPVCVGVVVYLFAAAKFQVLTREDCLLLPKGEKIAKLLKL